MMHLRETETLNPPTARSAKCTKTIKAGPIFRGGEAAGVRTPSTPRKNKERLPADLPNAFRWVHLSNQIVEALISLKTKKIPILRAAPFAKRAAFCLTPSCAECPILPHGVSPYRESKSCQQV